jgi:NAD(P)-dependent dehydrogenase (short-subunit alcohol dehydrogenase family)
MPEFHPNEGNFNSLKGKVVVLTGTYIHDGIPNQALAIKAYRSIRRRIWHRPRHNLPPPLRRRPYLRRRYRANPHRLSSLPATSGSITFTHCDVSSYAAIYALFRTAYDKHGRVDHAIGCTGILEQGKWFDPELDIESVREPETGKTLDVNLGGMEGWLGEEPTRFLRENKKFVDEGGLLVKD